MKLFLDRNKTLLPRVDNIYFFTRILTLAGLIWFGIFHDYPRSEVTLVYAILATFVIHLVTIFLAIKEKFDIKLAYLSSIIYDLILIPVLVLHTGGLNSSYFLLFYLTVSVSTYVLTRVFAAGAVALAMLVFLGSIYNDLIWNNFFAISIRIGFMWVYYLALSYASNYTRKSERRLLKLFDTLNKRTSELEKSQAQLEMIYENTRALASLLDVDGVISEVMRIMGQVLHYQHYGIINRDRRGNFFYRARAENGRINLHPKAIDFTNMGLVRKVFELQQPVTVNDIVDRDDYISLSKQTRSLILVPMTSHGRTNGILIAESNTIEFFGPRDLQMLSAVARSAGLALENAELHKRMEELTIIDELTGAYNYRYFVQKLEEEKRRALRYNLPLSLIMIDIDWFKKLNDSYGHETGNLVLKRLADIIRNCIRDVDIFSRYGGEEFIIILPQTPRQEAERIGERARETVEQEIFDYGDAGRLRITVSVGISSFPENGKSHEELVSVADQALYRAKGEGRNLVRVI